MRKFVLVVGDNGDVWSKLRKFKLDAELMLVTNLDAADTAMHALLANNRQVAVVVIENPVMVGLSDHLRLYRRLVTDIPTVAVGIDKNADSHLNAGATFAVTLNHLSRRMMVSILEFKG